MSGPIPVNDATDYTKNWRVFNANHTVNGFNMNEILANAFTFDKEHVQAIVDNPDAVQVRVYLGYTTPEPQPSGEAPIMMNVMLVGVDANGKDLLFDGPISGVYDFAMPCPKTCDFTSPLVTG